MKKRIISVVVLIVVIVLIGYFYKTWRNHESKLNAPKMGAAVVPFATAKATHWQEQVKAIGTIYAKRGVTLRAEVAGRVTHIYYESGQTAKKGQPLFQIYPDVLEAQLKAQQAALVLAKYKYDREARLYKAGAVSQEAFKIAQSNRDLDSANLAATQAQLRLTTVHAPFMGIVGLRQVEVGDYVNVGDKLATFQSKSNLRLDFSVPGSYGAMIHDGQKITFTLHGNTGKTYQAKIYAINPLINVNTRMMDVWASLKSNNILPGSYAEVTLYLGKPYPIITVPQTAVMKLTYGSFVYQVVNGKAKKIAITPKARRGNVIGITKGLKAGDVVVSGNQLKVRNGSAVTDKGAISIK